MHPDSALGTGCQAAAVAELWDPCCALGAHLHPDRPPPGARPCPSAPHLSSGRDHSVPRRAWGGRSTGLSCPPWPPSPSRGASPGCPETATPLPLEGWQQPQPAFARPPVCEQQGLPETRRRSLQWGARKLSAILGPPAPGLRVTCAPCPVWAVPKTGGLYVCPDLCAERSRPPGPHAPQSCWRDDCSAVSGLGLPARSAGQLGQAGQAERKGGWWAVPPCNPPALPPCLWACQGKWGLPSCIRRVLQDSRPHTSVPGTGRPQNRAPCSLQRPVRADQSASNSAWPVTLPAQLGKPRRLTGPRGAPSQRPCGTHFCLPKCPCPTELRCPGLRQGLQRRWSEHHRGL